MSHDSKELNENSSPEISVEHQLDSPKTTRSQSISRPPSERKQSTEIITERPRSQSVSRPPSERKQSDEIITQRPPSPTTRHRVKKQEKPTKQRTRSNSPRKTFSYLTNDGLNVRKWKQQQRQLTKQEEENRIYKENRQKLERLAKIAKEPSAYPTVYLEQERLRERHAIEHQRKILKNFIPILKDNLCIVDRLANIKGVYDAKQMKADFAHHTQIVKREAINRKKAREIAAQRPFILPKINLKS